VNIKKFIKNSNALSSEASRAASDLDAVSLAITDYIQKESAQNHMLLNRINACNTVFEALEGISSAMLENTRILNEKIISSCAAIEVAENAEAMLKDIRKTFPVIISYDSSEKDKQIRQILENMNKISYQCAHFQTFPKPYKDIIDLYNVKIESVFRELLKRPYKIVAKSVEKPFEPIPDTTKELAEATAMITTQTVTIRDLQKIIDEKTEQNIHLAKEVERIEKKAKKSVKRTSPDAVSKKEKKKFIVAIAGLGIALIILFNVNAARSSLSGKNSELLDRLNAVETTYSDSRKVWALNVSGMDVGNANRYNQWIAEPGAPLKADEVYNLNPVFTYDSPVATASATFFVKIFEPDGIMARNETSPQDYTFSGTRQIKRGTSSTLDLDGWKYASGDPFYPGTWTIELWYEGFCLYRGEVILQ
jgi:hypothetical protein